MTRLFWGIVIALLFTGCAEESTTRDDAAAQQRPESAQPASQTRPAALDPTAPPTSAASVATAPAELDPTRGLDALGPRAVGMKMRVHTDFKGMGNTGAAPPEGFATLEDGRAVYSGMLLEFDQRRLVLGSIPPLKRVEIPREHVRRIDFFKEDRNHEAPMTLTQPAQ